VLAQSAFRERDISGIAETELTDENVVLLGKALATYLIRYSGRIICLGRDARESSPHIHAALVKGLRAAGASILDIGIVPTPVLFHSVFNLSADAGIMITGGDESPKHNGFRLMCGTSAVAGRALEDIFKVMSTGDFESGEGHSKDADAMAPYVEQIVSQFQFRRGIKVHIQGADETAETVLRELLKGLKVSSAKQSGADLTLKLSPGMDRLEACDEKGHRIPPELLFLLLSREILSRKPGSVLLYDERFPEAIPRRILELTGTPVAIASSELSIQARLRQEHAELSVLQSGEIVFADRYYGFEDALYAACRVIEIATLSEDPISVETKTVAEGLAPAS
jgi:phosphomannomutase/phosphoglucomutase